MVCGSGGFSGEVVVMEIRDKGASFYLFSRTKKYELQVLPWESLKSAAEEQTTRVNDANVLGGGGACQRGEKK